jgi:hypothetical protein
MVRLVPVNQSYWYIKHKNVQLKYLLTIYFVMLWQSDIAPKFEWNYYKTQ